VGRIDIVTNAISFIFSIVNDKVDPSYRKRLFLKIEMKNVIVDISHFLSLQKQLKTCGKMSVWS
jgi:hypothetical protein